METKQRMSARCRLEGPRNINGNLVRTADAWRRATVPRKLVWNVLFSRNLVHCSAWMGGVRVTQGKTRGSVMLVDCCTAILATDCLPLLSSEFTPVWYCVVQPNPMYKVRTWQGHLSSPFCNPVLPTPHSVITNYFVIVSVLSAFYSFICIYLDAFDTQFYVKTWSSCWKTHK
jgi:hypothetical protein